MKHETIVHAARANAERVPGLASFVWIADGEEREETLDAARLDAAARAAAAHLQALGAGGERVLLLVPPGLDFVTSWFGCLYAGAVAVPAATPRRASDLERSLTIARRARARFAVAEAQLIAKLPPAILDASGMTWIAAGELPAADPALWRPFTPGPDDLAFLQFTSGSTAEPRGVMVTHKNLTHNAEAIWRMRGPGPTHGVQWLPPYHDMGLVGCIAHMVHSASSCVAMSPQHFLQRPARWLLAATRHRAELAAAPDFAFRLCVERVSDADLEHIDLSTWRHVFCGAEPVRPDTWEAFTTRFAPCGVSPKVLAPSYGLAEATLMVTGRRAGAPLVSERFDGRRLFSCGEPVIETEVIIASESLAPLPEGEVGEILVRGPSVAQGYFADRASSERTFDARVEGHGAGWLRTGDLGFLRRGHLFVAGRMKDLIKIRGKNHYPQDLEETAAAAHPAIALQGAAAFSAEDGAEEKLVVLLEVKRTARKTPASEIVAAATTAIVRRHGVSPSEVSLLRPGALPRTSSGKLMRIEARARWRASALELLDGETVATP